MNKEEILETLLKKFVEEYIKEKNLDSSNFNYDKDFAFWLLKQYSTI
jgi:hypothetical protein